MPDDNPSKEDQICQLEAVVARQREQLDGLLPEADIVKTLAPLQARLASLRGADVGPPEPGPDDHLSVAIPVRPELREALRDVLAEEPEGERPSFRQVLGSLRLYLSWCRKGYGSLRLHGATGQCQRDDARVSELDQVFVPVRFRRLRPSDGTEEGEARIQAPKSAPGRRRSEKRGQDEDHEVRLEDLLTTGDRLAVIGGAGSGKSTLLAYLSYHLAGTCGGTDAGPPFRLPGDAPFLVPFVVPFREYRQYREQAGESGDASLAAFITSCIERQVRRSNPKFCGQAALLCDLLLRAKCCLLLLDGLDEIASAAERPKVRAAVETLINDTYPGNRVVVTSRGSSYHGLAVFGEDFGRLEVQSLNDDETGRLVGNWCRQLYPVDGQAHVDELLPAIREMNARSAQSDDRRLIGTPLLVTMVVSVEFGKTRLPRQRAKLYEACVEVILTAQYSALVGDKQEPINWGGPWEEQRDWLAKLAFEMHCGGSGSAAIAEARVREILAPELSPEKLDRFLEATRSRGGLFEEKAESFQFLHLTFQEFLAARYLAKSRDEKLLASLVPRIADSWWREALLLLHGFAASDYPPFAARYLRWLSERRADGETRLAGLELAGSALLEQVERQDEPCRQQAALLLEVLTADTVEVTGPTRGRAGNTLAALGDPRSAVTTLDGMEFCLVPEGPFWMGSGPDDRDADDRERPLHEVRLPAYWIARYPVTVAQFAEYVAHSGHKPGDRDSLQGMPNHPVVWVSWRETVAFCEWLTKDWQAKGRIPPRWRVRLPSEAEWEKAARGGTRIPQALDCMALPLLSVPAVDLGRNEVPYRRFPWGDEQPDADRANCSETGIGDTSAVGSFPKGTSPYGCEDMAGNAYEWTRSRYTKSGVDPGDGADLGESPQKGDYAVVRGGAFWLFPTLVRCACRNWDGPLVRGDCCGFRVVLSPFLRS